jgi:anthranilate/para-aminobenzoate synthase component I
VNGIFSRFKWNANTVLELDRPLKAYIYYKNERLNLLTGFPESYPIAQFTKKLSDLKLQAKVKHPLVFHFYYEYGLIEQGFEDSVDNGKPLVIELEYQRSSKKAPRKPRLTELPLKTLERPSWSEYKVAFQKIQEELVNGNCYQVNLTFPFDFMTEELLDPRDINDFFFAQKNLGAYAHSTFLGEEMILSNSPECLFQYRDQEIFTMPIKGTLRRDGKSAAKLWQQMLADKKEEGELLMITDLLKNDLNRLDTPSAKVRKLRAPLLVPGLLHQYSLISLKLKKEISVADTMKALFPGGSITGAPKKRVMEIIDDLERYKRGVYCGSTLLCYGNKKVASINIRTASINIEERMWRYGAGGGITLLSRPVDEFKEMEDKVSSFLKLLKIHGF